MKRFILIALLLASSIIRADGLYDPTVNLEEEKPWEEEEFGLPPYPVDPEWIPFPVTNTYRNSAYVDGKSIKVGGKDRVARFALRIVTPSGVENISYEGMRCSNRNMNTYAYGDTYNKRWITARKPAWRIMPQDDIMRRTLIRIICEDATPDNEIELANILRDSTKNKMGGTPNKRGGTGNSL